MLTRQVAHLQDCDLYLHEFCVKQCLTFGFESAELSSPAGSVRCGLGFDNGDSLRSKSKWYSRIFRDPRGSLLLANTTSKFSGFSSFNESRDVKLLSRNVFLIIS